jgi:uncharacterized protein (TIGR03437 family)
VNYTRLFIIWTLAASCLLPAGAQTYSYDAAGRLVRAIYPDGRRVSYTYDDADNLLTVRSATAGPAPVSVSSLRNSPSEATVSWASSGASNGYVVERRVAGSTRWTVVATLPANASSYFDTGLSGQRAYEYRVAGIDGNGQSAYSATAPAKVFGTPEVYEGGIVNGASFGQSQPVAAGSIVSIFGTAIGFTITGNALTPETAQAAAIPLPVTLNGITVLFDGVEAPLYFVGGQQPVQGPNGQLIYNGQINAQVPWEMAGKGLVEVLISAQTANGVLESEPVYVEVAPEAPAIFTFDFGGGRAAALNVKLRPDDGVLDASPAQPVGVFPGRETQPAPLGGIITVYCNGLGAVTPAIQTGRDSMDALRRANTPVKVLIGGVEARVDFAGLAPQFVGLNQINVFIPDSIAPGPAVPIVLEQNGVRSRDDVTIAVRAP